MSKFTDKIKRLHRSRVRALDEANRDEGKNRVYIASDVVETENASRRVAQTSPARGRGFEAIASKQRCWVLERRFESSHSHGRYKVGDMLDVELPLRVDDQLHLFSGMRDPSRLGFFDIETSGLARDAVSFCIGLGVWQGNEFVVRQFLMDDPSSEKAVLEEFAAALDDLEGLVTFNGRSFDVPRVDARMQHHGVSSSLRDLEHVDLLRIARRFFPRRGELTLEALEQTLTMFHRIEDLPGSEAPARWNTFQETGRISVSGLEPVFDHNRLDILSLTTLLVHLSRLVSRELPYEPETASPSTHSNPSGPTQTESAPEQRPTSELTARLKKTYRLRQGRVVRRSPDQRVASSEVIRPLRMVRDDESPNSFAEVGDKVGQLRREAAEHLEAHRFETAVPILHEMIALSPHNPYPIAQLARYYRLVGDEALAALFEDRLEGLAPY